MIRNADNELVLGTEEWITLKPLIFDDNGNFVSEISQVKSEWNRPFYVYGESEYLDTLESILKDGM